MFLPSTATIQVEEEKGSGAGQCRMETPALLSGHFGSPEEYKRQNPMQSDEAEVAVEGILPAEKQTRSQE